MARRVRRNSSNGYWKLIFWAVLVVVGGGYFGRSRIGFNVQNILDGSILKEKNFAGKVVEVVSPKRKIKAYLLQDSTNPIVAMSFLFKNAGLATDVENQIGISNMVAALLAEGTQSKSSQNFKEELENLAISVSFGADLENFSGSVLALKENQTQAMKMLNEVLVTPRFEKDDVQRVRAQMLLALKRQKEHPANVLNLEFVKELYQNHPYGRNPIGQEKAILSVVEKDLRDFVTNYLNLSNLIVGVAGDVSESELGEMLDLAFDGVSEKGSISFVRDAEIKFDGRHKNIALDAKQSIAKIASLGVSRSEEDFYPLFVANHIFGGAGLNSRISQAIREKEGLTYSVYTTMSLNEKSPLLLGSFSTTPENYAKVMKMLMQEWETFGDKGASQEEFDLAKKYLISSYNLRFASLGDISSMLVYMQKDDLGIDFLQKRNEYIRSISLKQVNAAAKKHFNKEKTIAVGIGTQGEK